MQNTSDTRLNDARYASGINVLLGIWLIVAPYVLSFSGTSAALWNDIIVGAAVFILGLVRLRDLRTTMWASWVNLLLGIWMVIGPYVLSYSDITNARWNDIVVGIAVAILAAWSLFSTHQTHAPLAH